MLNYNTIFGHLTYYIFTLFNCYKFEDYMKIIILVSLSFILFFSSAYSNVFDVGPSRIYTSPSMVMAIVNDGDTVNIEAGVYPGDVGVWTKNNLLIRGIGDYAHLKAEGQSAQQKAIWVITGNNTTIEFVEFSECTVPDRNGAGIRQEGSGLTIRHCYFHHNEDGILAGDNPNSDIIIENTEFAYNGFGDGYSHNLYINHVRSLKFRFCYSHHAVIGHNFKSRAYNNYIEYNRIMDENTGNSSMLIDLPNGGNNYIIGNLLMKGVNAENRRLITFGTEGLSNPENNLYVINNTMVNLRNTGTFIFIQTGTSEAKVINNIFSGNGATLENAIQGIADTLNNLYFPDPTAIMFADLENFDYHLTDLSPAINSGTNPGFGLGYNLTPSIEYIHLCSSVVRNTIDEIDAGGYEYAPLQVLPSISVSVKALLQNYWNGITQRVTSAIVELRTGEDFYNSTLSQRQAGIVNSNGLVSVFFSNINIGEYWLVLRASSHLPIVSANRISVVEGTSINYDFSTSQQQALNGTGLIQQENVWVVMNGDVDGNLNIDALDYSPTRNNFGWGSEVSEPEPEP